jgi:hypothetical protein
MPLSNVDLLHVRGLNFQFRKKNSVTVVKVTYFSREGILVYVTAVISKQTKGHVQRRAYAHLSRFLA